MTCLRAICLAAVIAVVPLTPLRGVAPDVAPDVAEAVRRVVHDRAGLVGLYQPIAFVPLWITDREGLSDEGRKGIRLLESAADEGLDTADYHLVQLQAFVSALHDRPGDSDVVARLDVALSEALLRYLQDLHMGRVDPRAVGFKLTVPRDDHDFAALLRDSVARRQLVETAGAWLPRGSQYPALAAALASYRRLAGRESTEPLPFRTSVHPGDRYDALRSLHARLLLLGDVDARTPSPDGDTYEGALVDGVKHFQSRHGLEPDGVLGTRTMAQLAVPLGWRVRQLELAMERLRWLPHLDEGRLVLVNIPMFRLLAWDTTPPKGAPAFTSSVIVGRAKQTESPVFAATLSEIQFRPYWNVPTSILRKEILPRLAREPDYLEREQMELVAGQGDRSPVVPATGENLAGLRSGAVRLRQRAGPANALGLIKFSFPNENDVYMHATPAQALFARSRRDFSHGCVRVADPVGLAVWVLNGQPGWDRQRILEAMEAAQPSRVGVRGSVRVLMFYSTAAILPDSGDIVFADDLYHLDARLDRALRER